MDKITCIIHVVICCVFFLHFRNTYDELINSGNVNQYEVVLMKGNRVVQTTTDVQTALIIEIKK